MYSGLFQGLEFLLQASVWELMAKWKLGLSRMWNCWQLLRRSRVFRIQLGRDADLNARTLLEFAEKCFAETNLSAKAADEQRTA